MIHRIQYLRRRRQPNIGLTFKAWPELLRGIGVVFASSFRKNHDKRLYKVEAVVGFLLFLYFYFNIELIAYQTQFIIICY